MSKLQKWEVSFTTPAAKGKQLKETIEDSSWQYARAKLESKYPGLIIKNYTPTKQDLIQQEVYYTQLVKDWNLIRSQQGGAGY